MSLDDRVDMALSELVPPTASVRVEVISHDSTHDVLSFIELKEDLSPTGLQALLQDIRRCFSDLRQLQPEEPCLKSWSAYIEWRGTRVASTSALDRAR
ncbi:hypothetical protein AACH06_03175 [Ideonella sp. DXS29W]|uniref:Uncharacterized protein n=1 Tax=Ideonella lacteola TaxID=2984193 RepID=A0ABU9BIM1_9BURK